MQVQAWNNGAHHVSGAGYGVRIGASDRDRHFLPDWGEVFIEVPGEGKVIVPLPPSFWRGCSELRSIAIGRWMLRTGLAPWPTRRPPRLELRPRGDQRFELIESQTREFESPWAP